MLFMSSMDLLFGLLIYVSAENLQVCELYDQNKRNTKIVLFRKKKNLMTEKILESIKKVFV